MSQTIDRLGRADLTAAIRTFAELKASGISEWTLQHQVRAGDLVKIRRGIYCPGAIWQNVYPSDRYFGEIFAYFRTTPNAVFSHQSAAVLHSLGSVSVPARVQIYCPKTARGKIGGVQKFPRDLAAITSVMDPHGILCTEVEQTILDCARTLPFAEGVAIADSYISRTGVASEPLREKMVNAQGRGGEAARKVGYFMSDTSGSVGESLLRVLMHLQSLPQPEEQFRVVCDGRVFYLDFAYPDLKVAIEFDGRGKYTDFGPTDAALINEREREKMLTNEGWIFVRVNWNQVVHRPHHVAALIRRARQVAERRRRR